MPDEIPPKANSSVPPGVIGGWALFSGRSWGRPLVLVPGFIHLINIPLGTALGNRSELTGT